MKEQISIPDGTIGKLWFSDSPRLDYFHRHDELECNIICRGRGSYLLENQRIDLEARTIAWLFPGQEHLMLDTSHDFALWILVIRPSYLQQSCTDPASQILLQRQPKGLFLRHIDPLAFDRLENICHNVLASQNKLALFNAALGYLLHTCWDTYQQGSVHALGQNIHPAINQIAKYLVAGQGPDDLQTLSQLANMAPATISRLFKRETAVSLTTYRNRCRLKRFLAAYGSGFTQTMFDAALDAGFGSYAQFYRVFSQIMGQTPAQYRRQVQQKRLIRS